MVYSTTKAKYENRIVAELNANVLELTFEPCNDTVLKADVYKNNSSNVRHIVLHKTCSPSNSTFIKSILIDTWK